MAFRKRLQMIDLRLEQIAEAVDAKVLDIKSMSRIIKGVSIDSRLTAKGDIFFALKGKRDGHEFAQKAFENGARALVVARPIDIDIPQLVVIDPLKALGQLAGWYRRLFDIPVIGITGSVGKTTTREMIRHVLSENYNVVSAPGNFNNLIGLPLSILQMDNSTQIAVFELGINQPGEMEQLVDISRPSIGIITRIAPVHLELLGSIENIAREKVKLWMNIDDPKCIYNLDDEMLDRFASMCEGSRITYGVKEDADFYASKVNLEKGFPSFSIDGHRIELQTLGIHNIYNALAAYATASLFEIPAEVVARRLSTFTPFDGRMTMYESDGIIIIDDSYNASPVAVKSGISTLTVIDAKRKIAVLGDMLELGLNETRHHRDVLEFALESDLDRILLVGRVFKRALQEMHSDMEIRPERFFADNLDIIDHFEDSDSLRKYLMEYPRKGDLLYFKGSKKMNMGQYIPKSNKGGE